MDEIKRDIKTIDEGGITEENIGLILSKLESIEEFFPCYKSMMKK
ncbi:hypothetical protein ACFL1L_03710 [Thermoplasmatota archaeon]